MKFKDIQGLSAKELKKKQAALRKDLFEATMKNSLGQLSNPLEIRKLRRQVAQVATAITLSNEG